MAANGPDKVPDQQSAEEKTNLAAWHAAARTANIIGETTLDWEHSHKYKNPSKSRAPRWYKERLDTAIRADPAWNATAEEDQDEKVPFRDVQLCRISLLLPFPGDDPLTRAYTAAVANRLTAEGRGEYPVCSVI